MALTKVALWFNGDTGTSLIDSSITQAITSSGNDVMASISSVLGVVVPIALGIMGLVLAIKVGIRLFKSLTKTGAAG